MTSQPMSRVDHAWLRMDNPANRIMVNSVLWTDRPVDVGVLRAVLQERMIAEFPRFTQRPEASSGLVVRGHWVRDEAFDLDRHLVHVTLDPPGDRAMLQRYVGEQQNLPLDPSHPMWEVHVISGYQQGSAVLFRVHHSIADGMALARLLLSLTDEQAEDGFALPDDGSPPGVRTRVGRLLTESIGTLRHPSRLVALGSTAAHDAARLAHVADLPVKNEQSVLNGEVGQSKLATWSAPIPLDGIKAIGKASGCTVNDVMLAALGGAFRRYLIGRGEEPADVPVLVPVDLRAPDKPLPRELGNNFGFFFVNLPSGTAEPGQRLVEAHRRAEELKESPEALVTLGVLAGMGSVPGPVEDFSVAFFVTKSSGLVTNVPGPRNPVTFAGATVDGIIGWVPRGGDMTFGVAIFSYNGAVTVGFSTDAAVIPDPETLVTAFEDEVATMSAATSQP